MNVNDQSPRCACLSGTWIAISVTALLAGCGAGTAAVVSGGGGGSDGNSPPAISGFTVLDPKLPAQARVRFVLSDPEADAAHVELFYQAPGEAAQPLTQAGANPAMLATSSAGIAYELPWNFAAEPELPDDAHFIDDVQVFARLEGGVQEIVLGANAASTGLGNDPPEIHDVMAPAQETSGIVGVEYTALDSSSDTVSVRIEYDIQGDDPDAGWRTVRPALADATPSFAVENVVATKTGTSLSFFWDTNVDLAELEHDVKLRFRAKDPVVTGAITESSIFRVDNNAEPIATISDGLLVLNPDQRAGITVPYTVRDEESDAVQVVFQWKRHDEEFPLLPDEPAEINAILADPAQRQERHICTEYPTHVDGRAVPIDASHVRLPELATGTSSILMHGLVDREIDILRASKVPKPIAATWAQNPLNHPVAALPIGDGIEALVVDQASAGTWRLRQLDLATGSVIRAFAAGTGDPSAAALEERGRIVFVASDVAGTWRIARIDLDSPATVQVVAWDGSTESGRIQAIACQGPRAVLATVGSSLVRVDFGDGLSPSRATLLDGLATPWGLALDSLHHDHLFLAEHTAGPDGLGRILRVDLNTLQIENVTALAPPGDDAAFPRPTALALAREGRRLLVTCDTNPFLSSELRSVDFGRSNATTAVLLSSLPGIAAGLATGSDGVIAIALTSQNDLAVGNGIEQRRSIDQFDPAERVVHVSSDFRPLLSATQSFRVRAPSSVRLASPSGARGSFVWDSTDLPGGGNVELRAVPMDAERGVEGATDAAKLIRTALDTEPLELGDISTTYAPVSVVAADLDCDGDLDLVSPNAGSRTLTVFFQETPGVFGSTPLSIALPGVIDGPYFVVAADMDGDGDLDLASANGDANTLYIFFQESPGVFGATPLSMGDSSVLNFPYSLAAADLDGDGDLDLACANGAGHTLTVFFQEPAGVFSSTPLSLGDPIVTDQPFSVIAADLDGDSDVDLASANYAANTLTVFFQTSPGVFPSTPLVLGDASVTNGPQSISAGDLDGDGDLDLASANLSSGTITVFFQETPGVFRSTPLSLGNSVETNGALAATTADLDSDGDLDLAAVVNYFGGSTLVAFFQTSPGVFDPTPSAVGGASESSGFYSVAAADLDGDAALDLLAANVDFHKLVVFFQQSPGVFDSTPLSLGHNLIFGTRFVATADLDADGDLDLASGGDSGKLSVFFQQSLGVFDPIPLLIGNPTVTDRDYYVTAADLDGDGDLDLASANVDTDTLSIYFQESPGVFASSPLSLGNASVTDFPAGVTAADIDGDGKVDVASANLASNTLAIFFQESPGTFSSTPLSLGNAGAPFSIVAADLDGDGDLDLASGSQGGALSVFFQTSPRVFGSTPLTVGNPGFGSQPRSVVAADLDGDGDLDLAAAHYFGGVLTIFFQVTPGVFGTTPVTLGGPGVTPFPQSIAAGDLDGDGDVDLVSANSGDKSTIFFQETPGVFRTTPLVIENGSSSFQPQSVVTADVDGDGDLDIVSAHFESSALDVHWNNH